jgi:hypothetical protein
MDSETGHRSEFLLFGLRPTESGLRLHLDLGRAKAGRAGTVDLRRRASVLGRDGLAADRRPGARAKELRAAGGADRLRLCFRCRAGALHWLRCPRLQQRRLPAQFLQWLDEQQREHRVPVPSGVPVLTRSSSSTSAQALCCEFELDESRPPSFRARIAYAASQEHRKPHDEATPSGLDIDRLGGEDFN